MNELRHSTRATYRKCFHFKRLVRLELYDDNLEVYKFNSHIFQEGKPSLLKTAKYSDITKCVFIEPRTAQTSTWGGFIWGDIGGEIRISLTHLHIGGRRAGTKYGCDEELDFRNQDIPEVGEEDFRHIYSWLCDKAKSRH